MGSLDHHPIESEPDDPVTAARNRRVGIVLFLLYASIYAGYVWISAFQTEWIEATPWGGVNIAVWYGLALIGGAFVLALVYGWICRAPVGSLNARGSAESKGAR